MLKTTKGLIKAYTAEVRAEKESKVVAKVQSAQARKEAAIAKLQEKLAKAMAREVKSPAQRKRAARKAGPVIKTEGAEANAIAAAMVAKREAKKAAAAS